MAQRKVWQSTELSNLNNDDKRYTILQGRFTAEEYVFGLLPSGFGKSEESITLIGCREVFEQRMAADIFRNHLLSRIIFIVKHTVKMWMVSRGEKAHIQSVCG